MTQALTPLRPAEPIEFDHDVLMQICELHGDGSEAFIARLLGQIESNLFKAARQHARGARHGLRETCNELVILARTVGMRTLDDCAEAVMDCLARRDEAALAACLARMVRLTDADSIDKWQVQRGNTVA